MTDVVVVFAKADAETVAHVQTALLTSGFSIHWITIGDRKPVLDPVEQAALTAARAVVFLLTPRLVEGDAVQLLDQIDKEQSRILVARLASIDTKKLPFALLTDQSFTLVGWRGDPTDLSWVGFLSALVGITSPPIIRALVRQIHENERSLKLANAEQTNRIRELQREVQQQIRLTAEALAERQFAEEKLAHLEASRDELSDQLVRLTAQIRHLIRQSEAVSPASTEAVSAPGPISAGDSTKLDLRFSNPAKLAAMLAAGEVASFNFARVGLLQPTAGSTNLVDDFSSRPVWRYVKIGLSPAPVAGMAIGLSLLLAATLFVVGTGAFRPPQSATVTSRIVPQKDTVTAGNAPNQNTAPSDANSTSLRAGPATANQTSFPLSAPTSDIMRTRFVVRLDREAKYTFLNLPNRIVVELPDVKLLLPPQNDTPVSLVQGFTGGIAGPGRARVIIDVAQPVMIENDRIEKAPDGQGYLLAFEMIPSTSTVSLMPTPQMPLPEAKPTVVVDPGYGGDESGPAIAAIDGFKAKDVTLAVANALRVRLQRSGQFNVVLTRDTDQNVLPDSRRGRGEDPLADALIALRLGQSDPSKRGATIFVLDGAGIEKLSVLEKSSFEVAANPKRDYVAGTDQYGDAVKGILSDLTDRDMQVNAVRSGLLARSLAESLKAATAITDEATRLSQDQILMSTKVPSAMIELANAANVDDAKRVGSAEWQEDVARALAVSIEDYFAASRSR